jgi:hypothetical protein
MMPSVSAMQSKKQRQQEDELREELMALREEREGLK